MNTSNQQRFFGFLLSIGALASALPASGQGKGEGAIVLRDNAPVYRGSTGDKTEATLQRGDFVAGVTTAGLAGKHYEFEEDDGRVHVAYFRPPKTEGTLWTAWMDPADLATFLYDCGCDRKSKGECRPYNAEFMTWKWNACFKEARNNKLAELRAKWEGHPAGSQQSQPQGAGEASQRPTERPLTNDDLLALIKLDLGDDTVIAKIRQAPEEALDVSTESLVSLKKAGVNKAVIDAMIKRVGERK